MADKLGLVTVLAHPGWIDPLYSEDQYLISDDLLFDLLCRLDELGLDGVEVSHQINDSSLQFKLKQFALEHGMICTGGSDFHGDLTGYGSYLRKYGVNDEQLDALIRRIDEKQCKAE